MAIGYSFSCPLPNGVHARPASAIEEVARGFASNISLHNERTGQTANAKSVLSIVGIDIRSEDACRLTVEGTDERDAFDRMRRFFEDEFARCDEPLLMVSGARSDLVLPRLLADARVEVFPGTPVVPGIGIGRIVAIGGFTIPDDLPLDGAEDVEGEVSKIEEGIARVVARYERGAHGTGVTQTDAVNVAGLKPCATGVTPTGADGVTQTDAVNVAGLKPCSAKTLTQPSAVTRNVNAADAVLAAHRAIARDPEFRYQLERAIRERNRTAAGAIADAEAHFTAVLAATGSALLRERALDIRDVCTELLVEIYGHAAGRGEVRLTRDSICAADLLTPGQFLALDRRFLRGLVLSNAGTTSHTVILARSFGIPTLVGLGDLDLAALDGLPGVVDADLGVLTMDLREPVRRYYQLEQKRLEARRAKLAQDASKEAVTADGVRIEVAANIGTAEEAAGAFFTGAEGIGLFRTEMLFADRDAPPSEDEQFEQYRQALVAAGGKPVIIRTLDVGGDKPIPYLNLPPEANPFLGYRAVRIYPEFEDLFRTQIRALLCASAFGTLQVMVPMVSRLEEVRWVKRIIREEQAERTTDGLAFDSAIRLGAMIEVPSTAFALDHLCRELDFFSIGTNDLLQYFVAADRVNARTASLHDPFAPAFLRLLKQIVDMVHFGTRWVGLCGEMAGMREALPLLVGLGLDEISMAAPSIAASKALIRSLPANCCRDLFNQAVACATSDEVRALLARFECAQPVPLLETSLIVLDSEARSKAEAIKQAVDCLFVNGRTEHPREVEDAVWRREAVYSTGFGHGFAIPHCKSDAVTSNSLVILRLRTPVEWGSLDDKPVGLLILLAIRESEHATAHMRVLAQLARQVMHEDFREHLLKEEHAATIRRFVTERVGA